MGKSKATLRKYATILRLKLVAAVLSVNITGLIRRILDMKLKNETFQTDSKVALGYINNNIKNFDILVAS